MGRGKGVKRPKIDACSELSDSDAEEPNSKSNEGAISISQVPYDQHLKFADIGGLDSIKKKLLLVINDFVERKSKMDKTKRGVLFYGAPGTGKTFLAMCLVAELNRLVPKVSLYMINGSDKSKYFGETEKIIKNTFEMAKETSPSVILIDEIDNLGSSRDTNREEATSSVVSQLLIEIQNLSNIKKNIIVIGITNMIEKLDPALIRSGRMDVKLQFLPPTETGRLDILDILVEKFQFNEKPSQELLQKVAKATNGCTGADLECLLGNIIDRAKSRVLGENVNNIARALGKLRSSNWRATPEDWLSEAKKMKPTGVGLYGSSLFIPYHSHLDPKMAEALFGEVEVKLVGSLPNNDVSEEIIKPILVSGTDNIYDINNEILPTIMSKFLDRFVLFTINRKLFLSEERSIAGIIFDVIDEAIACSDPAIVFIPSIDAKWLKLTEEQQELLQTTVEKAKRNKVLIIASAATNNLHRLMQDIFNRRLSTSLEVEPFSPPKVALAFEEIFQQALDTVSKLKFKTPQSKPKAVSDLKRVLPSILTKIGPKVTIEDILNLKSQIQVLLDSNIKDAEELVERFKELKQLY